MHRISPRSLLRGVTLAACLAAAGCASGVLPGAAKDVVWRREGDLSVDEASSAKSDSTNDEYTTPSRFARAAKPGDSPADARSATPNDPTTDGRSASPRDAAARASASTPRDPATDMSGPISNDPATATHSAKPGGFVSPWASPFDSLDATAANGSGVRPASGEVPASGTGRNGVQPSVYTSPPESGYPRPIEHAYLGGPPVERGPAPATDSPWRLDDLPPPAPDSPSPAPRDSSAAARAASSNVAPSAATSPANALALPAPPAAIVAPGPDRMQAALAEMQTHVEPAPPPGSKVDLKLLLPPSPPGRKTPNPAPASVAASSAAAGENKPEAATAGDSSAATKTLAQAPSPPDSPASAEPRRLDPSSPASPLSGLALEAPDGDSPLGSLPAAPAVSPEVVVASAILPAPRPFEAPRRRLLPVETEPALAPLDESAPRPGGAFAAVQPNVFPTPSLADRVNAPSPRPGEFRPPAAEAPPAIRWADDDAPSVATGAPPAEPPSAPASIASPAGPGYGSSVAAGSPRPFDPSSPAPAEYEPNASHVPAPMPVAPPSREPPRLHAERAYASHTPAASESDGPPRSAQLFAPLETAPAASVAPPHAVETRPRPAPTLAPAPTPAASPPLAGTNGAPAWSPAAAVVPGANASASVTPSSIAPAPDAGKLLVGGLAFCRKVESYGVYTRFEREEFAPGQEVLLYAEVENFASELGPDGYRTVLESGCRIFDRDGEQVAARPFPKSVDVCRNRRRDYFHTYRFVLPTYLRDGDYRLQLVVQDALTGDVSVGNVPLRIRSRPDASRAEPPRVVASEPTPTLPR